MRAAPIPTDEILTRLCKALSEGMDRFEARASGDRYKNLVEKHWDAASKAMFEREAEIKQELERQGLNKWRRPR